MATNADRLLRYTGAFLVALGVALPFIAGGQSAQAAAPPLRPVARPLPPFDLSYVPACEPVRLVALRPAEFARLNRCPATFDRLVDQCLSAFVERWAGGDLRAAAPPAFADIEQCVFQINVQSNHPGGNAKITLTFGTTSLVLRTVKPFDWSDRVKKWFPKGERVWHTCREYVRANAEMDCCVFVPDDRTMIIDKEGPLRKFLEDRHSGRPSPSSQDCLGEASSAIGAVSFDNRDRSWLIGKPPGTPSEQEVILLFINSLDRVVLSLKYGDHWSVQVAATARSEGAAQKVVTGLESLLASGSRELARILKAPKAPVCVSDKKARTSKPRWACQTGL
jgi:hypothetical protein